MEIWMMQAVQLVLALLSMVAYAAGIVIGVAKRERCPHVVNKMIIGLSLLLLGQVVVIGNSLVTRWLSVFMVPSYYLVFSILVRGLHLAGVVMLCAAALSATSDPYEDKRAISPPLDTGNPYM